MMDYNPTMAYQGDKRGELRAILQGFPQVLIACSGGTDSSFLLACAAADLGPHRVRAVTAETALSRRGETEEAVAIARALGVRTTVVHCDVLALPEVEKNAPDRCYHCKKALFSRFLARARQERAALLDGSHADDAPARRPGARALRELSVRSPLAEAGLGKEEIRALSGEMGLSTADRPSSPCLATRFPYGVALNAEGLRRVEEGEGHLAGEGLRTFRLRHHGDTARVEADPAEWPLLLEPERRARLVSALRRLGWRRVTLDLEGFRPGSFDDEDVGEPASTPEGREQGGRP
jgi:uncharacterized protein